IGVFMEGLFTNVHIHKPEVTDLMLAAYSRMKRDDVLGTCFDSRQQWYVQLIGARTIARAVAAPASEAGSGRAPDKRKSLLVFGDSSVVALFQGLSQFTPHGVKARLFPVPGASIAGLGKRYSTLDLMPKIEKCIERFAPDYLLLKFGQVDVEYGYYHQKFVKRNSRLDFTSYCRKLVDNYLDAVEKIGKKTMVALNSVNLPSVFSRGCCAKRTLDIVSFGETANDIACLHKAFALQPSFAQRTRMVMEFNEMLGGKSRERGLNFIDLTPLCLDTETNLLHEHLRDDEDTHYVTSARHRAQIIDYTMEKLLRE
ncbi:MAG: hypothetical protein RDU30_18560, partial [Desulfovibrionaceae bacterium]|nr:hypothetical protein [Desulfovibrionaceae bacterium]